jgi:chromosome segregation ATPase
MSDTPKTVWIENPEITELRAKLTEAEAEVKRLTKHVENLTSIKDDAIHVGEGLVARIKELEAERDAARAEVQYLLKLSSKYAADLQAFCCNPRAALSAHLNSTENTNG